MNNLSRIFHTIGQGAFYTEEFYSDDDLKFIVVYDCGSLTLGSRTSIAPQNNKELVKKVRQDLGVSKSGLTKVDILFISHFDIDHINGCLTLQPKVVIIPFLSAETIAILSIGAQLGNNNFQADFYTNIDQYFPDATILRVLPAEQEPRKNDDEAPILIDINEPQNVKGAKKDLNSGSAIQIANGGKPVWEYIVYNPNWNKYYQDFKTKVDQENNLDYGRLIKNPNGGYITQNLSTLTGIYNNLKSNKNSHSLQVYSGPLEPSYAVANVPNQCKCYDCDYCLRHKCIYDDFPSGCLYFGDIKVNDSWLNNYYGKLGHRLENVGTVQISHHGAYSGQGDKALKNIWPRICVISVGEYNQYGHPSSTIISRIVGKGSRVHLVTERATTLLHEKIRL